MFCSNCGNQISDDSKFCPECGAQQNIGANSSQDGQYYYDQNSANGNYADNGYANGNFTNNSYGNGYGGQAGMPGGFNNGYGTPQKSRLVAGLLQIFLGWCGVGRFYLGYTGMGLGQLFSNFLCGIGYIWAFIDGILILCGQVKTDARGIPLKD